MQFSFCLALVCAIGSTTVASEHLIKKNSVYDAVTQIGDGQIQATTSTTIGALTSPSVASTLAAVTQIGDGQIQATTATTVASTPKTTSKSKTQVTIPAVTQIGDGQIQATTASQSYTTMNAVTQIGDGQIQATTLTAGSVDSSDVSGVRTVATLIGSQYNSYSASSKTVSGNLSGNLVTITTTNANGVTVTVIGSAVVTDSAGDVSIAIIASGSNSQKTTKVSTSNGVLVTVVTGDANQVFNYGMTNTLIFAFVTCVYLSTLIL